MCICNISNQVHFFEIDFVCWWQIWALSTRSLLWQTLMMNKINCWSEVYTYFCKTASVTFMGHSVTHRCLLELLNESCWISLHGNEASVLKKWHFCHLINPLTFFVVLKILSSFLWFTYHLYKISTFTSSISHT